MADILNMEKILYCSGYLLPRRKTVQQDSKQQVSDDHSLFCRWERIQIITDIINIFQYFLKIKC